VGHCTHPRQCLADTSVAVAAPHTVANCSVVWAGWQSGRRELRQHSLNVAMWHHRHVMQALDALQQQHIANHMLSRCVRIVSS
jgi:hypothetical protein